MVDYVRKIRVFENAYHSGIYTKDEAIGGIMGVLAEAHNFREIWNEIPDWVRLPLQEYLKECSESTILYDYSNKSSAPISPALLALKNWLDSQR